MVHNIPYHSMGAAITKRTKQVGQYTNLSIWSLSNNDPNLIGFVRVQACAKEIRLLDECMICQKAMCACHYHHMHVPVNQLINHFQHISMVYHLPCLMIFFNQVHEYSKGCIKVNVGTISNIEKKISNIGAFVCLLVWYFID